MGLLADQRKKIDEALTPLKVEAMRTDPINRDVCIDAFNAAYEARGLRKPELVFCTSPWDALQRVDGMVSDRSVFKEIVGDEIILKGVIDEHVGEIEQAYNHPLWGGIGSRVEKVMEAFCGMANAVDSALEEITSHDYRMLFYGNNSLWEYANDIGQVAAAQAIGIVEPPKELTLGVLALLTCNKVFAYERFCFISERPQDFTHPALSKVGPQDRIIISWRDGFACDMKLRY